LFASQFLWLCQYCYHPWCVLSPRSWTISDCCCATVPVLATCCCWHLLLHKQLSTHCATQRVHPVNASDMLGVSVGAGWTPAFEDHHFALYITKTYLSSQLWCCCSIHHRPVEGVMEAFSCARSETALFWPAGLSSLQSLHHWWPGISYCPDDSLCLRH
jgi:hypothetical protein